MRFALILAGGSGTRLWPMSRRGEPKQLIPLVRGRSLLELALERVGGIVEPGRRIVCAAESWRQRILSMAGGMGEEQYIGEPTGRDTLAALSLSAAVIARRDADATIGVFTADQLIEPVHEFRAIVATGYDLVEAAPDTLLTFGITPTHPSTGYGYLELGGALPGGPSPARRVARFREKPDPAAAARYVAGGRDRYLWNSGMFLWKATRFLSCVRKYRPRLAEAIDAIAAAWDTPSRAQVLSEVYPGLERISVDYAVMEPASLDPSARVAALPMDLDWKDIGSWTSMAGIYDRDEAGNSLAADTRVLVDSKNTLVVSSDPGHLVAAMGCEDLIIVHTPDATLVCRADRAEDIKKLQERVAREAGERYT